MLQAEDEMNCDLHLRIHLWTIYDLVTLYLTSHFIIFECMFDNKGDSFNHVYANIEATYEFQSFCEP